MSPLDSRVVDCPWAAVPPKTIAADSTSEIKLRLVIQSLQKLYVAAARVAKRGRSLNPHIARGVGSNTRPLLGADGRGALRTRVPIEIVDQARDGHALSDEGGNRAGQVKVTARRCDEPAGRRAGHVVAYRAGCTVAGYDRQIRGVVLDEYPRRVAEAVLDGPRERVQHQDGVV